MTNRNFVVGELVTLVLHNCPFNVSGIVWKVDSSGVWLEQDYSERKFSFYDICDVIRN